MTDAEDDEIALPEARDRPATLLNRVEFAFAYGLGAVFRLIGVDAASALSGKFTRLVGPMLTRISDRGLRNLEIAFPEMPEDERAAIIKDVWENLGRTTAEFAHLEKFDPNAAAPRVEIVGRGKFDAIVHGGKQVIFFSGHFANWEVMPIVMHAVGLKYGAVYRAANNPLIDGLIIKLRGRVMSRRQIPKGKRGGREMIDAMKSGASLAMFIDQKLTTGGIPSPFFGKPAMTAPAAARLALKYGAPLVPIELERVGGAQFRLTVGDEIEFLPSGESNADIQKLTDILNLELERMIRARPGEWLWLHRRWPKEDYGRKN